VGFVVDKVALRQVFSEYFDYLCVSITKANELLMFEELIAVHCENRMKNVNAFCGKNTALLNVTSVGMYN
jgi:hypothetical protein